jgi:hypothetical protein
MRRLSRYYVKMYVLDEVDKDILYQQLKFDLLCMIYYKPQWCKRSFLQVLRLQSYRLSLYLAERECGYV